MLSILTNVFYSKIISYIKFYFANCFFLIVQTLLLFKRKLITI